MTFLRRLITSASGRIMFYDSWHHFLAPTLKLITLQNTLGENCLGFTGILFNCMFLVCDCPNSLPTPQKNQQQKNPQKVNQSISQFYFLLSATSSMPLALYNGAHTLVWTHRYTYTVKYSRVHIQAFIQGSHFGADTMFLFQAHTLSHWWTLRAARAVFILGNPSLVLKSQPGVPPSTLQSRQHHSRPTLIQPLVELLSLSRYKWTPIFCVTGKQANHSTTTATNTKQNKNTHQKPTKQTNKNICWKNAHNNPTPLSPTIYLLVLDLHVA